MSGPLSVIAELTHSCPLRCVYCSNPVELKARAEELPTDAWLDVIGQSAALKVLQFSFTGGEPLLRPDLEALVSAARSGGLYTNLITSGVGLTQQRLGALVAAGLDHVQLSFQDVAESSANEFAGVRAHAKKLETAALVRAHKVAFTVNLVVHRRNLDRLGAMIDMAVESGADRLEIANTQYYGWAFENRAALMPTPDQVKAGTAVVAAARERLKNRVKIEYVVPDYYAKYPKACMGGWARTMLLVDPTGRVLPCHAAMVIPGLVFDNVKERRLAEIWRSSDAFNRFRGEAWMKEPCSTCERRTKDFGGCHCQAAMLAGDATLADPACSLSPAHDAVASALSGASFGEQALAWRYRPVTIGGRDR